MADDGSRGRLGLALAGILATATVGIVGSVTTLLVSRENQETARSNRVYERRAATYVDAIDTLEKHLTVLTNLDYDGVRGRVGFRYPEVRVDDETDAARIRSRLLAFGSADVVNAFEDVAELDKDAFAWVYGERPVPGLKGGAKPEADDLHVWWTKTGEAVEKLRGELTEFEARLNRELTS